MAKKNNDDFSWLDKDEETKKNQIAQHKKDADKLNADKEAEEKDKFEEQDEDEETDDKDKKKKKKGNDEWLG